MNSLMLLFVFLLTIAHGICYFLVQVTGENEAKVDGRFPKTDLNKMADRFSRQMSYGNVELARRMEDSRNEPIIFAVDAENGISADYNGEEFNILRAGTSMKASKLPAESIIKAIHNLLNSNAVKHSPQMVEAAAMIRPQEKIQQPDMYSAYPGMRHFQT